jgi:hypothetical protein
MNASKIAAQVKMDARTKFPAAQKRRGVGKLALFSMAAVVTAGIALGICRTGFAQTLPLSESAITAPLPVRVDTLSIRSVPRISEIREARPYVILQGRAAVLEATNTRYDAIYTFAAGPCPILAISAKGNCGKVEKVGLAHIDAMVNKYDIVRLLNSQFANLELEITIIGGAEGARNTIIDGVNRFNGNGKGTAKIKYSNTDRGGRDMRKPDCAAIGKDGTIYYGKNPLWEHVSSMDMMRLEFERMMPDAGLDIMILGNGNELRSGNQKGKSQSKTYWSD